MLLAPILQLLHLQSLPLIERLSNATKYCRQRGSARRTNCQDVVLLEHDETILQLDESLGLSDEVEDERARLDEITIDAGILLAFDGEEDRIE